jgi:hypothetical protein
MINAQNAIASVAQLRRRADGFGRMADGHISAAIRCCNWRCNKHVLNSARFKG